MRNEIVFGVKFEFCISRTNQLLKHFKSDLLLTTHKELNHNIVIPFENRPANDDLPCPLHVLFTLNEKGITD